MNLLVELFTDYTLRNVALGSGILGLVSGSLGTFAVLRRQSLLGDTISHAALPGIAMAFLISGSKSPLVLLLGASIAGWIGASFILSIINRTKIKEDSAQGIVLSVFFGLGLVLLTYIQKRPDAAQAGLDTYLFGQAATLMTEDVIIMSSLGFVCLVLMAVFWKELKILSFDPEYAFSLGFPVRILEAILTVLIVFSIVIGLQTVGVVLMSSMLVAPGASARQWTNRLGGMVVTSAFFGAVSGISGALISSVIPKMPTGPAIVVVLTAVSGISILLGSERGLYWKYLQRRRNRKVFAAESLLETLCLFAEDHHGKHSFHEVETLHVLSPGTSVSGMKYALSHLADKDFVSRDDEGRWGVTAKGFDQYRHNREAES